MSAPAAFKATYSDLRFVKSRKVAQVMLELPIEQADAFVKAFGTPNPASETWVGIARLDLSKAAEPKAKEKRNFSELPLSQQAALVCRTEAFWKFLNYRYPANAIIIETEEGAATLLYDLFHISSRAELDANTSAAHSFHRLYQDYQSWLNEPL